MLKEFKLISSRLWGNVSCFELEDGEGGYFCPCLYRSTVDEFLYFSLDRALNHDYGYKVYGDDSNGWRGWVGRRGNKFYIKLSERCLARADDLARADEWFYPPAALAYNVCYPLVEREGEYYVVPCSWGKGNKYVDRNCAELRSVVEINRALHEKYGCIVHFGISTGVSMLPGIEKRLELVFDE